MFFWLFHSYFSLLRLVSVSITPINRKVTATMNDRIVSVLHTSPSYRQNYLPSQENPTIYISKLRNEFPCIFLNGYNKRTIN